MKINLQQEEIELLPERAFYWKKHKLLGFSDIHLGKAESLQAHGIPLPSAANLEDLETLQKILQKREVQKVFILGDFIHQRNSWGSKLKMDLKNFFAQHPHTRWNILLGNHDQSSRAHLEGFNSDNVQILAEDLEFGPFLFTHGHREIKTHLFQIFGHFHPVVHLREGPIRLKLPCFVLKKNALILPSFGALTGGSRISFEKNDRVFAVADQSVFEV